MNTPDSPPYKALLRLLEVYAGLLNVFIRKQSELFAKIMVSYGIARIHFANHFRVIYLLKEIHYEL